MNDEIIFVVEESLEGGYEAKALGHSIFTQAETMEELKLAFLRSMMPALGSTKLKDRIRQKASFI